LPNNFIAIENLKPDETFGYEATRENRRNIKIPAPIEKRALLYFNPKAAITSGVTIRPRPKNPLPKLLALAGSRPANKTTGIKVFPTVLTHIAPTPNKKEAIKAKLKLSAAPRRNMLKLQIIKPAIAIGLCPNLSTKGPITN
jgi:hypothetical protein